MCLRKEYGDLGVRKLGEFNIALLGKWCWRLLVDREGLWRKVLVARYGVEDGRLEDGGRSCSSWWREIVRIRDGVGGGERWFAECVRRRAGDGSETLFWRDCWYDDVPFCDRFSRLFDLAENKDITVRDMFSMGWEDGGEGWQWRRRLWAWEEELVAECRVLLSNINLQDTTSDSWLWMLDSTGGYCNTPFSQRKNFVNQIRVFT